MNNVNLNTCKITHFSKKIKSLLFLLGLAFSPMSLAAELDLSTIDGTNGVKFVGDSFPVTGRSVSNAGDFNGDGFDDFIIVYSSTRGLNQHIRRAVLLFGTPQGLPNPFTFSNVDGTNGFRLKGLESLFYSNNISIKGGGDVNGDGLDDLLITTTTRRDFHIDDYKVFILYGSSQNVNHPFNLEEDIDGNNGVLIHSFVRDTSVEGGDVFETDESVPRLSFAGESLAGDINGDGIDDLVLENFSPSETQGDCHVIFGQSGGLEHSVDVSTLELDGTNGFYIDADSERLCSSIFRRGVSTVDINHDGIDDLILGGSDGIYVVYGSTTVFDARLDLDSTPLNGINGFKITTVFFDAGFDRERDSSNPSISSAGDVNGDGIDDVIIGHFRDSQVSATLLLGNTSGFQSLVDMNDLYDADRAIRLEFNEALPVNSRIKVSGAGDVNSDGLADIIVGAAGSSYLLYGNVQGFSHPVDLSSLDDTSGLRINSEEGSVSGIDVSGAGDFNGDGVDDILINGIEGTPGDGSILGAYAYLIYGPPEASPVSTPSPVKNLVTNYRNDFKGPTQSPGWDYFWNPSAKIGISSQYESLQWTGFAYDSDGVVGRDSSQLNYGHLSGTGGHPGKDQGDGVSTDRFVIASYQVDQAGVYHITDSIIEHPTSGCSRWSNGGELRIYVNDSLRETVLYDKQSSESFDTALGNLEVGDRVYVAVGPNGREGCDKFLLNYSIKVEEQITNTPNTPPELINFEGAVIPYNTHYSVSLRAFDADGDQLSFQVTGLPNGSSVSNVNDTTVGITIPPAIPGTYLVTVIVTDTKGATDEMTFPLTANAVPGIAANYLNAFRNIGVWSYLWNANGPVGTATNYASLQWNGFQYDGDGVPGPEGSELSYGKLGSTVSHPGKGVLNGAAVDRFVIAAHTISLPGSHKITDSYVEHLVSSCSNWSNGGEVRVYINDELQTVKFYGKESRIDFDRPLGHLIAGDTLYVAVGANGSDGCDAFSMDFSVTRE